MFNAEPTGAVPTNPMAANPAPINPVPIINAPAPPEEDATPDTTVPRLILASEVELTVGNAQKESISIFSNVVGFSLEAPRMRQLLYAHWAVAVVGTEDVDDYPTSLLVRSIVHAHTTSFNSTTGQNERVADQPHITTSWTTSKLHRARKFRTAHGYTDPASATVPVVKGYRFNKDKKDQDMSAPRYVDGRQSGTIWPPDNKGRFGPAWRKSLNDNLPKGWKDIRKIPDGTGPLLTA